ncbi:hypothetical protein DR095_00800 [Mycoplasma flocculare]|uniref:Uncharacterized protein n=1 Tax=Mesomycoplasma flocculare TaxID=2128 RepID=A0AAW9XA71_MESFC|nr:hypothetical protein [Mesomycoplasma flocculare]MXR39278.1 hypothetical protein [Mycoplasma sp. MF12]MXR05692.1 hypothetical protein [Mesomycoplasma flocculare]MXR12062.1 hypothetical protein [Mesomycoplasma flocculare]MXR13322.1 hypothetical protein [Mesomycoplasma flocculare]MXR22658.1 hypothetical protein [Mesomycoplasma flocculare]
MFQKKQKKPNFKYETANQVVYGNVVFQKLKEIKYGKKISLFIFLFVVVLGLILTLVFLIFHFAGSGNNLEQIISRG